MELSYHHCPAYWLAMYLFSIVAAIAMAFVFKSTILKGPRPPFILELPQLKVVLVYMTSLAWVASFAVYHDGKILEFT